VNADSSSVCSVARNFLLTVIALSPTQPLPLKQAQYTTRRQARRKLRQLLLNVNQTILDYIFDRQGSPWKT
jgi:hypothetical protein